MKIIIKTTYLHMFSKTGRMSIRLVATSDFTIVWFVRCVNMTVFFSVTRIGKSSVTSLKFTTEWFFTCKRK